MKLKIDEQAMAAMKAHAEEAYPNECVGFFYGKDGEVRQINLARRAGNSKEGDQRRRFEVSPKDYMDAERFALKEGIDLLGIYHSHPEHPAIPSEHDLKFAQPFFSYIIVSVKEAQTDHVRSWQLDESGQFEEEKILQT